MRVALIAIAILALAGCSKSTSAQLPAAVSATTPRGYSENDPMFKFLGTWHGTLDPYSAPHYEDADSFLHTIRIVIKPNRVAQVFTLENGKRDELKQDTFAVEHYGPHAIVVSTTSGKDSDGTWVESYVFTLDHLTPDELVVYSTRIVNNLDMRPGQPHRQFAFGHTGILHLLTDDY